MFCSASTSHIEGEAPPTGGVEKEEEEGEEEEVFQGLLHILQRLEITFWCLNVA